MRAWEAGVAWLRHSSRLLTAARMSPAAFSTIGMGVGGDRKQGSRGGAFASMCRFSRSYPRLSSIGSSS